MGIFKWLAGWKYIGNTLDKNYKIKNKLLISQKRSIDQIHPKIIKLLLKKADYIMRKKHTIIGPTVYIRGSNFIYCGKQSNYIYFDNQGHGGYLNSGMKIWRKAREDKKRTTYKYVDEDDPFFIGS
jgi:hypothetical protein